MTCRSMNAMNVEFAVEFIDVQVETERNSPIEMCNYQINGIRMNGTRRLPFQADEW